MSSGSNKEGKLSSALLSSFLKLNSVIQPKKTLNLIQNMLVKTIFHLAPFNHFFPFSQLPPTSNAVSLKSPIITSLSNNIQLNIPIHFLFPAAFRPQHNICQLKKSLLMAMLFYVPVLDQKIKDTNFKTGNYIQLFNLSTIPPRTAC